MDFSPSHLHVPNDSFFFFSFFWGLFKKKLHERKGGFYIAMENTLVFLGRNSYIFDHIIYNLLYNVV